MLLDGEEYYYSTSSSSGEAAKCLGTDSSKKKKRNKIKKRFSDDQIKCMESIFESKSKLEPCKKLKLAEEIGLEPRQVAIWFQNKRARWKSKQLERDYSILQSNYKALASQIEQLNQENHSLVSQLQVLRGLIENGSDGKSKEMNGELEVGGSGLLLDGSENGAGNVVSDEHSSIKAEYLGIDHEESSNELLNMVEPENWGSLEANDHEGLLVDQSSSSYQWWNFWS